MAPADVRKHTVASLANVPVMKEHHGRDFYKFFFTTHPEHRRYYKGAENFNADDVEKSERFDKLGNAILLNVHVLANTYDNVGEPVFRAFTGYVIDRHVTRGLEPVLWKEFWGYWKGFLENKGTTLSAEQKEAWDTLGKLFNEEAQAQLKKHGLPHV
ncbi:globin [Ancylostoma ceylanicum]|uniref:Globin n=1 Tax=Ancylostoma ceylanicum TaxID=53326 RepID=A0A0D6LS77_9BILA|nr:globin [Ancylostoma ceylanicum]